MKFYFYGRQARAGALACRLAGGEKGCTSRRLAEGEERALFFSFPPPFFHPRSSSPSALVVPPRPGTVILSLSLSSLPLRIATLLVLQPMRSPHPPLLSFTHTYTIYIYTHSLSLSFSLAHSLVCSLAGISLSRDLAQSRSRSLIAARLIRYVLLIQ